jgi:hypothetical protein
MSEDPGTPPPPAVGELLPRATEVFGVHYKLATYSLDTTHEVGGPKAKGFELILGITIGDIDHLATQITAGVLHTPIGFIRDNPPHGINCVVELPIQGSGAHSRRVANVRTAWIISTPGDPPRLVSAYIKP